MTSRDRILMALKHKEADRVPRDLGGTESSGMTAHSLLALQRHLGKPQEMKVFDPYQYVAYIGDGIRSAFRIDTANLTPGPNRWTRRRNPAGFEALLPEKWIEEEDAEGSTVVRRQDGTVAARRPRGGYYFDPVNPPLRNVTDSVSFQLQERTIRSFDYPSFSDEPLTQLRERARTMRATGACTVFNLCCHLLAAGQLLCGYEEFMIHLLTDEILVRSLLDRLVEGYLERIARLAPLLRESVDIVLLNDDLGTQNAPMLAPHTYRKIIKPYQKVLFGRVKESFGVPILFHSCGAVRDLIPDLIEVGVDALNPIQISARGMELQTLKRDFGDDIAFWGGGVDTQTVLNGEKPSGVRDAVKRSVDALAPGGGFVFCQVHNIQPDVPPENVVAMFEALDACGMY